MSRADLGSGQGSAAAAAPGARGPAKRRAPRIPVAGGIGAAILLGAVLTAVFAPWIAPYGPADVDITARLKPPAWLEGGTSAHWLGTDQLGRDLLSRIVFGARSSLLVSGLAVLITLSLIHI